MPVGSTPCRSVQVSGFGDFGLLTPAWRLVSASCSSSQRFAIRLPSDSQSPAKPLPSANCSPCRASRGLSPPSECALPGAPKKKPHHGVWCGSRRSYADAAASDAAIRTWGPMPPPPPQVPGEPGYWVGCWPYPVANERLRLRSAWQQGACMRMALDRCNPCPLQWRVWPTAWSCDSARQPCLATGRV